MTLFLMIVGKGNIHARFYRTCQGDFPFRHFRLGYWFWFPENGIHYAPSLGLELRDALGDAEGDRLLLADALRLGDLLGLADGLTDSDALGERDGLADSETLGLRDSDADGV